MGGFINRLMRPDVLRAVQQLKPLAEEAGLTMPQFALAWVLREPNIASAIIGASRPEQVIENAPRRGSSSIPSCSNAPRLFSTKHWARLQTPDPVGDLGVEDVEVEMLRIVVGFLDPAVDVGMECRNHPLPQARAGQDVEQGQYPILAVGEAWLGTDPVVTGRPLRVGAARLKILDMEEAPREASPTTLSSLVARQPTSKSWPTETSPEPIIE